MLNCRYCRKMSWEVLEEFKCIDDSSERDELCVDNEYTYVFEDDISILLFKNEW